MRIKGQKQVEDLLPGYFTGEIGEDSRVIVEQWRDASHENMEQFYLFWKVWEAGGMLALMKQFDTEKALKKVDHQINQAQKVRILEIIQKIAAILLIPLLIYSGYITFNSHQGYTSRQTEPAWNEVKTTTGMHSEFKLPDGSQVWLNSSTKLNYPMEFGEYREVELEGEAFFDIRKDLDHPFIVKTGKINIEVAGTSFNVINYSNENQTEIILKSGKVKLFTGEYSEQKQIACLEPGQRAFYVDSCRKVFIENVNVIKYTAWKDGKLMFIDDPMDEVVRKLNRWFNVDILLQDTDLHEYVYKATFQDETLDQILELLKLSAPIEYTSKPRKLMPDDTFTKRKIIIKKRNI